MEMKFEVEFLPDAVKFMNNLENKAREKIYYNIRKAQITKDTVLFKKLTPTLWEFRTLYNQTCYRLFAFWHKTEKNKTIIIATHGLIKKTGKTPKPDLEKAERIRQQYFDQK